MKDVVVLLIHSYTVRHVRMDEEIQLEDFMDRARIKGCLLCAPKLFVLKNQQPMKEEENGLFLAFELPKG